jgi:DNA-binding transcriptional regulator YiaG
VKVLIRENLRTIGVNIYGTDGKLHTSEFFEKYFSDVEGAYPTLPEEREEFDTEAEWTIITDADFRLLAEDLEAIQDAIDGVQEKLAERIGVSRQAVTKWETGVSQT